MSTNIAEMRYRLLVEQGVDWQLNYLIPEIRNLLDGFFNKSEARRQERKGWDLQRTQLRNLLGVCGETDSVEVVIGFIEYQIGRDDEKKKSWAWEGFGKTLKAKLQALKEPAKGIVGDALGKSRHPLDEAARAREDELAWMELVRLYVGHLRRYFVYKKPEEGEEV